MTKEAQATIRLLICDDQAIVCEGLRAILKASDTSRWLAWPTMEPMRSS